MAVKDKYAKNIYRGNRVAMADDRSKQGELIGTGGGINNALVKWDDEVETVVLKGHKLVFVGR